MAGSDGFIRMTRSSLEEVPLSQEVTTYAKPQVGEVLLHGGENH